MHAVKSASIAKKSALQAPKKSQKRSIKTKKTTKGTKSATIPTTSALTITTVAKQQKAVFKPLLLSAKRKFANDAEQEDAVASYEAIQEAHRSFTPKQKQNYNEWLFSKIAPIVKQGLYASLSISRMAPAQPAMPDDAFMTEDLIETLVAHKLLVPVDFEMPIPAGHTQDNEKTEILDDLMHILSTFKIVPSSTLKKFKRGWINPKIEFNEEFETDAFNVDLESQLTPEELEESGIFTVGEAIDACFKMSGLYDIQYFQMDDTDADLELPPQPTSESGNTNFGKKKLTMFPFHEDPENLFVRDSDEFHHEHLDTETNLEVIFDIHNQFFRYDVVSTLHPDAQDVYDRVMEQIDALGDNLNQSHEIAGPDMVLFKMIIRDFYLQSSLYQNYLADPTPDTPFHHINMDFEEQMKAISEEQDEAYEGDEAEEEQQQQPEPPKTSPSKSAGKFKF